MKKLIMTLSIFALIATGLSAQTAGTSSAAASGTAGGAAAGGLAVGTGAPAQRAAATGIIVEVLQQQQLSVLRR